MFTGGHVLFSWFHLLFIGELKTLVQHLSYIYRYIDIYICMSYRIDFRETGDKLIGLAVISYLGTYLV